jgi:hypothetical protein
MKKNNTSIQKKVYFSSLLRIRKCSLLFATIALCFLTDAQVFAQWNLAGSNVYTNGNVGIGTSTPWAPLTVNGSIYSFNPQAGFTFDNRNPTTSSGGGGGGFPPIYFTSNTSWTWYSQDNVARLFMRYDGGFGYSWSRDVLSATSNGRVGIGTVAPQQALHVMGSVRSSNDVLVEGVVGIGTLTPDPYYKLSVNGSVRAKEIRVNTGWADFVFERDYKLRSLTEVEYYIQKHKHLPEIPSAAEVEESGVALGEMQSKVLQKIEELTLYIIELNKRVEKLENK